MDSVTLPLPVLIAVGAYLVGATAYIVKGVMQGSQNAKEIARLEDWIKQHEERQSATIDRIWTGIDDINRKLAFVLAKLGASGAAE
jgi:hypothetical protein